MAILEKASVEISKGSMKYISFGQGSENVIILPTIMDVFRDVWKLKNYYIKNYQIFSNDFKIYIFSPRENLSGNYSTKDLAREHQEAILALGIEKANLIGLSLGGMLAQHLAIEYSSLFTRLVLAASPARPSSLLKKLFEEWSFWAEEKNFQTLYISILEKNYREEKVRRYRTIYPIVSKSMGEEKILNFKRRLEICLSHNTYEDLTRIKVPTLLLGAFWDQVIGVEGIREMAQRIKNHQLVIFDDYGHDFFTEEEFKEEVLRFLLAQS